MSHCNTDKFDYFWICEPLARCAKRGSSLPLGTPMEIDFTSAYFHNPLPLCSKIVTPIISSISYKLFRPSGLPITQDFYLMLHGKVDPKQWTISWYETIQYSLKWSSLRMQSTFVHVYTCSASDQVFWIPQWAWLGIQFVSYDLTRITSLCCTYDQWSEICALIIRMKELSLTTKCNQDPGWNHDGIQTSCSILTELDLLHAEESMRSNQQSDISQLCFVFNCGNMEASRKTTDRIKASESLTSLTSLTISVLQS